MVMTMGHVLTHGMIVTHFSHGIMVMARGIMVVFVVMVMIVVVAVIMVVVTFEATQQRSFSSKHTYLKW